MEWKVNKNIVTRKKSFQLRLIELIKFRKTISFRIMRKITVNRKDKALTKMKTSEIFNSYFQCGLPKIYLSR